MNELTRWSCVFLKQFNSWINFEIPLMYNIFCTLAEMRNKSVLKIVSRCMPRSLILVVPNVFSWPKSSDAASHLNFSLYEYEIFRNDYYFWISMCSKDEFRIFLKLNYSSLFMCVCMYLDKWKENSDVYTIIC